VVVGAHYDHLGWGDEGSRHTGDPAIHNGADDNASGTAALMELARYYASHDLLFNNNYLFVAFSAEEKGLIGSKFMAEHLPVPAARINYMINMDMVGRLDKSKGLAVSGVGTCPTWPEALDIVRCFDWGIKTSESGAGPSDHTSFYLKDIPVLHFFTGTHGDYHKPSDDSDKINYDGLAEVTGYIATMINGLNDKGKLAFTKTQDAPAPTMSRSGLSVTMGIMPDYVFEGEGVKIDGVSENRPAAIAGVKPGDVLLQLGDYKLRDVQSYMQALGGFVKGDKTTVLLRRGREELLLEVAF
jgi:Zn-dependent M28 family amino/carboxypeptidase